MIVSFETPRLRLKELEATDYSADYLAWLQDPEISRFLETRHVEQTRQTIVAFIEAVRARPNEVLFGMFVREGDRHIGNIKVGPIHPLHRLADVSLFIGARDAWGAGFASEAIVGVSAYAFASLGVEKLSASMYAPNQGSRRAFIKAGYREEGLRRGHVRLDGERCDMIELGLLASDPAAAR